MNKTKKHDLSKQSYKKQIVFNLLTSVLSAESDYIHKHKLEASKSHLNLGYTGLDV